MRCRTSEEAHLQHFWLHRKSVRRCERAVPFWTSSCMFLPHFTTPSVCFNYMVSHLSNTSKWKGHSATNAYQYHPMLYYYYERPRITRKKHIHCKVLMIHRAVWLALFPDSERDAILANCLPRLREGMILMFVIFLQFAHVLVSSLAICAAAFKGSCLLPLYGRRAAWSGSIQCRLGYFCQRCVARLQLPKVSHMLVLHLNTAFWLRGGGMRLKAKVTGLNAWFENTIQPTQNGKRRKKATNQGLVLCNWRL